MARRSKNKNLPLKIFKYFVAAILIGFLVFVLGVKSIEQVKKATLFKVKSVELDASVSFIRTPSLSKLKGKSIFDVDLKKLKKSIKAQYPQVSHLRVMRKFPDRIYISARMRNAFAQIIYKRNSYVIDQEGVILSKTGQADPALVQITGVHGNPTQVPIGSALKADNLPVALDIVKGITANALLSGFKVSRLEVQNLSKINVYDQNNLRIILEDEKLNIQIKKLEQVLSRDNIKLSDFKYIDVRFQDPVLGKR